LTCSKSIAAGVISATDSTGVKVAPTLEDDRAPAREDLAGRLDGALRLLGAVVTDEDLVVHAGLNGRG
jgi:hypothetical protein